MRDSRLRSTCGNLPPELLAVVGGAGARVCFEEVGEGAIEAKAIGATIKAVDKIRDLRKFSRRNLRGISKKAKWSKSIQNVDGPGIRDHFGKHGDEVGATNLREYDMSARLTINRGKRFKFRDRQTGKPRIGYWDKDTKHFTSTNQYRKQMCIHTHFLMTLKQIKALPGFTWY